MTLQPRERRMLMLLPVGIAVFLTIYFWGSDDAPKVVAPSSSTAATAEKRLAHLREVAATVPAKEEILKKVSAELADREKSLIRADTAPQAQAQIVQILRRLASQEGPPIDIRATELGGISALGDSYGAANVSVQIECRMDQLVNFLASIGSVNELISTSEIRINSTNPKEKTVIVRLTVAGVVPRKLVPERKGGASFDRKMVLLNVLLIALVLWLGWLLRTRWQDEEAHRREILKLAVRSITVPPPPPAPAVQRPVAAEYLEVAQKTLFNKDRNSNVVIETPAPPPPPPPVPPLPVYRGQMAIGEPVVFLATGPTDEKGYRKGDTVGKFKLIAFDRDNITLEWDGKNLEHKLTDLVSREPVQQGQQYAVTASPVVAAAPVTSLGAAGTQKLNSNDNASLGVDMGGPRACVAGDNSPAGTVLSGYKKVMTQGLMGQSCHWEPVNR